MPRQVVNIVNESFLYNKSPYFLYKCLVIMTSNIKQTTLPSKYNERVPVPSINIGISIPLKRDNFRFSSSYVILKVPQFWQTGFKAGDLSDLRVENRQIYSIC